MDPRGGESLSGRPAGTGKSHILVALGAAAVSAGHRVRYFTAAELVETLYRGLADNSVGRVIDTLLRNDLVIFDLCRPRDYAEAVLRGCPWTSRLCGQALASDRDS